MAAPGGDSRKVVLAALVGNALIAVAKFVAAFLSGSAAMFAEAVHSVADTTNQALLLVGMSLSKRHDPERYPLGRGAEVYFWAFVVSLMLFLLGGVYGIHEGVKKLVSEEHAVGSLGVPVVVLLASICFEGFSFFVAAREFQKMRRGRPFLQALFGGRDPTIPVVLLEDAGAMLGLVVALVAIVTTWLTGSSVADGVGSLVIGILLCTIGFTLAFETHSLIIGESATPEMRRRALGIAESTEGVEDVNQLIAMHLGPETVVLALKVRFSPGMRVEDIERVTNLLEERIRSEIPQMQKIFVEADSRYDPSRDPNALSLPKSGTR